MAKNNGVSSAINKRKSERHRSFLFLGIFLTTIAMVTATLNLDLINHDAVIGLEITKPNPPPVVVLDPVGGYALGAGLSIGAYHKNHVRGKRKLKHHHHHHHGGYYGHHYG